MPEKSIVRIGAKDIKTRHRKYCAGKKTDLFIF